MTLESLKNMSTAVRVLSIDGVEAAQSGHPGMPLGMADVATVLFTKFLKFDPANPTWINRDRFVLSAGHGSMLLYSLNYLSGYDGITLQELKNFRKWGSHTAGHPEHNTALGIETTTGPLGQGLANAVGMAMAQKWLSTRYGHDIMGHHTYTIVGDGCLMEGISQEVISLAGHLKLSKLVVLFDDNGISIDGKTSLATSEDTLTRFQACGWHVQHIDGHDHKAIEEALASVQTADKPNLIACRTTIGFGAPTKSGTADIHGSPLGTAEWEATRDALGAAHWPAFEVPQNILQSWRTCIKERALSAYTLWKKSFDALDPKIQQEITQRMSESLTPGWQEVLQTHKQNLYDTRPTLATRQSSGDVLKTLAPVLPELLGGSADLTGSNNTRPSDMKEITPDDFSGSYLHCGVREHAMGAIMNGLALHGGAVPYGGTFLVFSDYCKPAIRLSALMGVQVIYVMTHDSIGLGEDGPTHQPIEHLASLRALPNLNVMRPCDAIETTECWQIALESPHTPSLLALTRQALPVLREGTYTPHNACATGGYILRKAIASHQVTLLATGSEVEIAVQVRDILEKPGIGTQVSSLPCWRLFDQQDAAYRQKVLSPHTLRVAIEAASGFGWERYVSDTGLICALKGFGASAPYKELYKYFGLTAESISQECLTHLKQRETA